MKRYFILSVIVAISFAGCKKTTPTTTTATSASMSGLFNGVGFTGGNFHDTMSTVTSGSVSYKQLVIKASPDTATGQEVIITVKDYSSGGSGTCLNGGNYYPAGADSTKNGVSKSGTTYYPDAEFTVLIPIPAYAGIFDQYYATNTGVFTITSCNSSKKTFAGTFSCILVDATSDTLSFSNVSFSDLSYVTAQ